MEMRENIQFCDNVAKEIVIINNTEQKKMFPIPDPLLPENKNNLKTPH